jgi:hypothetical protein
LHRRKVPCCGRLQAFHIRSDDVLVVSEARSRYSRFSR